MQDKIAEIDLPDGRKAELYESANGAPEIYIDGAWGMSFAQGGTCKINLFSSGPTFDQKVERRTLCVRLIMDVLTLMRIRDFLNTQIDNAMESGVLRVNEEK